MRGTASPPSTRLERTAPAQLVEVAESHMRPPEPCAQVRILLGAQLDETFRMIALTFTEVQRRPVASILHKPPLSPVRSGCSALPTRPAETCPHHRAPQTWHGRSLAPHPLIGTPNTALRLALAEAPVGPRWNVAYFASRLLRMTYASSAQP